MQPGSISLFLNFVLWFECRNFPQACVFNAFLSLVLMGPGQAIFTVGHWGCVLSISFLFNFQSP